MKVSNRKNAGAFEELLPALQNALKNYLEQRPHMTTNALSKRCAASEPTLRRILKGQIKTLPNSSTILDILFTISGSKQPYDVIKMYPGAIAQYLQFLFPQLQDIDSDQNQKVRKEISNPTKYLIYKMSANVSGVSEQQLSELFGDLGLRASAEMVEKGIIEKRGDRFFSKLQNFMASRQDFVSNFKLMSDFIKIKNEFDMKSTLSLKANYSESISIEAYKEILQIQNKALQKIRLVMSNESNHGDLPVFLLTAIDTFDTKPFYEE